MVWFLPYNWDMALFDWFRRYRAWGWKAGLAVLDQGLFSGANFIVNVLLARWLSAEEYGAYAVAFSVLLIFYQIHSSLLLEPMSILGPAYHTDNIFFYFNQQIKLHFFETLLMAVLLVGGTAALSSLFFSEKKIVDILFVMGCGLPFILLPWFFRRVFYILEKPLISVVGSLVYFMSSVFGLSVLSRMPVFSSLTAVILVIVSSFFSGSMMSFFFEKRTFSGVENNIFFLLKQNWSIGGWLVVSAALVVLAGQAQIIISGSLLGLGDAAAMRVLGLFIQPMILSVNAIGSLMLPVLSYAYRERDMNKFKQIINNLVFGLVVLSVVYELFLFVFSSQIELVLYAGKYAKYVPLIPVWGLIPLLLSINSGPSWGLQAAQKPYSLFIVSVVWVVVSVILGFILTRHYGVLGATISAVLGYLVAIFIYIILYKLWIK